MTVCHKCYALQHNRHSFVAPSPIPTRHKGCADCFQDVGAADRWYKGMADAALERKISIQYCLPSATDMLASLALPVRSYILAFDWLAQQPSIFIGGRN